jgi:hypothetical protein
VLHDRAGHTCLAEPWGARAGFGGRFGCLGDVFGDAFGQPFVDVEDRCGAPVGADEGDHVAELVPDGGEHLVAGQRADLQDDFGADLAAGPGVSGDVAPG